MFLMMLFTHELRPGDHIILRDFGQTPLAYRKRLMSLGLRQQTQVTVVSLAPLGCPLYLQISQGPAFALRKQEAQHLCWERV